MWNFDDPMGFGWVLVVGSVLFTIMIVGRVTSRDLPEAKRLARINKFKAAVIVLLLYWLFFSNPHVRSYSALSFREYSEPGNLATNELVVEQVKEQHNRIELLEEEVKTLRDDLYKSHQHYSMLLAVVAFLGSSLILANYFPNKNQPNDDEIQRLNL
jgi:hypothetical protein